MSYSSDLATDSPEEPRNDVPAQQPADTSGYFTEALCSSPGDPNEPDPPDSLSLDPLFPVGSHHTNDVEAAVQNAVEHVGSPSLEHISQDAAAGTPIESDKVLLAQHSAGVSLYLADDPFSSVGDPNEPDPPDPFHLPESDLRSDDDAAIQNYMEDVGLAHGRIRSASRNPTEPDASVPAEEPNTEPPPLPPDPEPPDRHHLPVDLGPAIPSCSTHLIASHSLDGHTDVLPTTSSSAAVLHQENRPVQRRYMKRKTDEPSSSCQSRRIRPEAEPLPSTEMQPKVTNNQTTQQTTFSSSANYNGQAFFNGPVTFNGPAIFNGSVTINGSPIFNHSTFQSQPTFFNRSTRREQMTGGENGDQTLSQRRMVQDSNEDVSQEDEMWAEVVFATDD